MPLRDPSHSSPFFLYHRFLSLPTGQTYTLIPVLICICLITNKVGHLLCIFIICIYSFVNCYSCPQSIFSLLKYLLFTCKKAEYIRGIHLSVMCVKNIFFLFDFGLLFNLKIVFFFTEGPLTFIRFKSSYLFQSSIFLYIL